MKRIIILSSVLVLLSSYSANAEVNLNIDLGTPGYTEPVYEEPAYVSPGYVMRPDYPSEHYDIHRHRHNDYWARRNQEEREHRGHEEHHGDENHPHR